MSGSGRIDFRLRVSPDLKERIQRYAATHPRRDDSRGGAWPLSLNAATVELLERALEAAGVPVTPP